MLVKDVELLTASKLDLVGASVGGRALNAGAVGANAGNLALGEGPGVVLVEARLQLTLVEDSVVRIELLHV